MNKKIKILFFLLITTSSVWCQEIVDKRIDNQHYWKKMIEKGLVKGNPKVKIPPAVWKGSLLKNKNIIVDSPDIPVSEKGNNTQSENSIFVNPTDITKALNSNNSASWNGSSIGTFFGTSYLSTEDFGVTWGGSVQGAGGANSGDPSVVINLSGRKYIGFIHSNKGQGVSYSDDGVNWTSVLAGAPTGVNILDKNHLWVDNSPSSPYEGNLYNAWVDFNTGSEIFLVRSTDDGLTYSNPIDISSNVNAGNFCHGVNISTGPNGEVYAVWAIYDGGALIENAIGFAKSTDGGATFEPAIRIENNIKGIRSTGVLKNHRVNSFPVMTTDISGGVNNGNIYVVWTNIGTPGINTGTNKSVYVIKSTNGGTTWEVPIKVNQGVFLNGKEAYLPWITSDPESGVLSTIFYDDRNVSSTQVETWVANSYDGGVTWENFRVSDVAFTPQPIPGLAPGYMGDYLGISARGGMVYPVWPDNRNGYVRTFTSPFEISNCKSDLVIINNVHSGITDIQESSNTIIATNIIFSGASAEYDTGNTIFLKPNFNAKYGSTFRAYIQGCNATKPNEGIKKNNTVEAELEPIDKSKNIKVYPNPMNNFLTIKSSEKIVDWKLLDAYGKTHFRGNESKAKLNISRLPKGIYILKAILKDGSVTTKKIIKN